MQGVYAIVNTVNWKMYIGSSVDIRGRWKQHRSDLMCGRHHCIPLQRAWKKYGARVFQWNVVEEVADIGQIADREQFWIDATPRSTRYNTSPQAGGSNRGIVRSDAFRAGISAALRKRVRTAQTAQAISLAKRGKALSAIHRETAGNGKRGQSLTDAHRQAIQDGHYKPLPTPEEQEEIRRRHAAGESARSIARETGISYHRVWRITNGLEWTYRVPGKQRKSRAIHSDNVD